MNKRKEYRLIHELAADSSLDELTYLADRWKVTLPDRYDRRRVTQLLAQHVLDDKDEDPADRYFKAMVRSLGE
jgi:hypothetical protein